MTDKARAYQKLDEQEKKDYEQDMINQGRAFELEQIKRKEEFEMEKIRRATRFQKELYEQEKEEAKKYTEKDFIEVYEGDTLQAKNRAEFENEKLKTKIYRKIWISV